MTAEKMHKNYSEETRIALLEQSINNINDTLIRFEKRFDQIDSKFSSMHSENKTHHRWTMGGIFGLYAIFFSASLGLIIKLIHG